MANYITLRNGSTGDDVRKLQNKLISAGYDVGEKGADGIYGSKTQAAVTKYQQDNKLQVDGVAGDETLGHIYGTSASKGASAAQKTTAQTPAQTAVQTPSYRYNAEEDPVYQAAMKNYQELLGKAPTLAGTYDQQLEDIYQKIMNREPFSYDLNGDALWNQYKDQYVQQGQMAMLDTMGQAAALTGGYGSTYAQQLGQQAYQGYLQDLNNKVPELYQLAMNMYNAEGDRLAEQFALTGDLAADEYGKYQDQQSWWRQDVAQAQAAMDTAYQRGESGWLTEQELKRQDENTAYNREQDEYSKQQDSYDRLANLISMSGYTPSQEELTAAGMSVGEAAAYANYYSDQKAAEYAGRSSEENESDNISLDEEQLKLLQSAGGEMLDEETWTKRRSGLMSAGAYKEDPAVTGFETYEEYEMAYNAYLNELYQSLFE